MFKTCLIIIAAGLLLVGCQKTVEPLLNASQNLGQVVNQAQEGQTNKADAQIKCQELCQQQILNDGENFDVGQCLSNNIVPGWVCDVAHSPRQPIDNLSENQCSAYRSGEARHFVEVDGNCNLIKAN